MARSGFSRRRRKVDANQQIIVDALRAAGCEVLLLASVGDGCPDLLVANASKTWLVEVKGEKGTLTPEQSQFFAGWPGEIQLVRTAEDALATIRK